MPRTVHLVRHGEVDNPAGVIYGSLPGFRLTPRGRLQARQAARYLSSRPVVAVWSSPLERAMETAGVIASRFRLPVSIEPDLTEWLAADRWAGLTWDSLPRERPGELETYLAAPHLLDLGGETLERAARRMAGAVERLVRRHPEGDVVAVSHQDPIQAVRLLLTGRPLERLHDDKPGHAAVVSLEGGPPWREAASWEPPAQDPEAGSPEPVEELGVGVEGELG